MTEAYFKEKHTALLAWCAQRCEGALPRQNASDESERCLGNFLNHMSALHRTGKLTKTHMRLLREVPGMEARLSSWEERGKRRKTHQKKRKAQTDASELVCPKCRRTFKSSISLAKHIAADTRVCRDLASKLSGGKPDKLLLWLGNKYMRRDFIAKYVPDETTLLVSPFFGSGAVEFALLRSRQSLRIHASDLSTPLVCFWQQMISSPLRVADEIDKLLPKSRLVSAKEFGGWHSAIKQDSNALETARRELTAARFYLVNKLAFNGMMMNARLHINNAEAMLRLRWKRLNHVRGFDNSSRDRLTLQRQDWFDTISTCPDDALLFIDPPYFCAYALVHMPNLKFGGLSNAHYPCGPNWGLDMHTRLRKALDSHERWIVCHEEHPVIRALYSGFHIVSYDQNTAAGNEGYTSRTELLILSPWVAARCGDAGSMHSSCVAAPSVATAAMTPLPRRLRSKTSSVCLVSSVRVSPQEQRLTQELQKLEDWVARSRGGALPKTSSEDDDERKLAVFLSTIVTHFFKKRVLSSQFLERLRHVPGMEARMKDWERKRSFQI